MKGNTKKILTFIIIVFGIYFTMPIMLKNYLNLPSWFEKNQIRLGLDLRGGSQLLLQVETQEAINEKLQNLSEDIRVAFEEKKIAVNNLTLLNNFIKIEISNKALSKDITDVIAGFKDVNIAIKGDIIELFYSSSFIEGFKRTLLQQSLEIIRKRIDEVGTNEPIIQIQGKDRVLIQLPGLKDPERIKLLLGKTAKMNFRLVDEKAMQSVGEKKYFVGAEVLEDENGFKFVVRKRIGVSGDNLVDASASVDQFNQPVVSIRFDSLGSRKFADLTRKNVGKRFAIILDDAVISAPVIRESIPTGNAQISGNFTFDTANDLAILLRAGSLPAPISIVEERSVGPSLGDDSIKAGSLSVMIAFSLVLIYMLLIYGKIGLIANFVLIVNFMFIISWLIIIQATLTLPGLAGLALTVGMAVDSNVLVFERIKEERKLGRSKISSINLGFDQALRAIIDANITTLIAAVILFFMGSGPIRGFSVTLGIGVLSTIICTMVVSRFLIDYFYSSNKIRELNF